MNVTVQYEATIWGNKEFNLHRIYVSMKHMSLVGTKKALVPLGICLNSDIAICIGTVSDLCAGCGYWMS